MLHTSKPFNTGIRPFDHYYGSHARGGDSWLLFGCPAAGKTTLACQTAGFSAKAGKQVLYITTKETAVDVLMRAYGAASGNPFSTVLDLKGSPNHRLAPEFRDWVKTDGERITIVEYRDVKGTGFKDTYNQILEAFYKKHAEVPDLAILDQLGGVLHPSYSDHIQKLEACNEVADFVAATSKKLDNVAFLITRANGRCSNKFTFTENDTVDSRTLCDSMNSVLGITSLLTHEIGGGPLLREHQYLITFKCREEVALRINVKRRFDLARFEGIADGQNS
jgi:hypothetical protein